MQVTRLQVMQAILDRIKKIVDTGGEDVASVDGLARAYVTLADAPDMP